MNAAAEVAEKPIRTGDTVKHGPTGETWVVAYVQDDRLSPCGWPPGEARLVDCTLVERGTDQEELTLLWAFAKSTGEGSSGDRRRRYAQNRLREMGLLPPLPMPAELKVHILLAALFEAKAGLSFTKCGCRKGRSVAGDWTCSPCLAKKAVDVALERSRVGLPRAVYTVDDANFIVATSPDEALALWRVFMVQDCGDDLGDLERSPSIERWPDDKPFTFVDDTGDSEKRDTKTAGWWAEAKPVGWFATSER